MGQKPTGKKIIAQNKKAYHDYFVEDRYEAGIQLFGTEVKSLRAGSVNLKDSYCYIEKGEIFATGIHISPYEKGNIFNLDPLRDRKLLMHKKEILKLFMTSPGEVFSPAAIYRKVWNDEPYGAESTVAVHIRHLREKIEINPAEPRYIKAVWGQGYKMERGK